MGRLVGPHPRRRPAARLQSRRLPHSRAERGARGGRPDPDRSLGLDGQLRVTDRLALTRDQVLAHRRRAGSLDKRMPAGANSLRRAAWAGLQDSMPRAAVLSIHARVANATPDIWEDSSLVQVWGPRFSAYVIPAKDRAPFTLGRMPDDARRQREFQAVADKLERFLD